MDGASQDRFWLRIIAIVSAVVCLAVAFLILGPRPEGLQGTLDVSGLPAINATLNALTTALLLVAWGLILKKRIAAHKAVMLTAFGTSTLFLVTYVIYHWFKAGPKPYEGDLTGVYYFILITHIVLAMAIIPLALITLYRGWNMHVDKHRAIARVTLPLWLYVSVTGVVIYEMLY